MLGEPELLNCCCKILITLGLWRHHLEQEWRLLLRAG
jgi:hypothetical protein